MLTHHPPPTNHQPFTHAKFFRQRMFALLHSEAQEREALEVGAAYIGACMHSVWGVSDMNTHPHTHVGACMHSVWGVGRGVGCVGGERERKRGVGCVGVCGVRGLGEGGARGGWVGGWACVCFKT